MNLQVCVLMGSLIAFNFSICAQETKTEITGIENGIYAVVNEAYTNDSVKLKGVNYITLTFSHKYSEADTADRPEFITFDKSDYVPMILEGKPSANKDDRGWTLLSVTLTKEQIKPLEKFTSNHLAGKVAIVIDGEIITIHKVRSVITGGQLQITRCRDDACSIIYSKLLK